MVWFSAILNKIKFFIIALTDTIKYLCCSRKQKRKPSTDFVPLSSVGIVSNDNALTVSQLYHRCGTLFIFLIIVDFLS